MRRLKAKRKKRLLNKERNNVPRFLPGDIFYRLSIVFCSNAQHQLLQVFLFKISFAYRFGFI